MQRRVEDTEEIFSPEVDETTFYEDIFLRTNLLLSKSMQQKLRNSRVAIIGLGGIGGIAAEMVARCGIGNIGLADIDCFEPSNLNRQILSNFFNAYGPNRRESDRKASIAKKRIKQINPFCKLEVIVDGINNRNVEDFCKKYDCILCQPDRESIKVLVHRIAKKYSIPVVTASRTNCNGNRWTVTAKVWDYKSNPDLKTFEETNHSALLPYSLEELTDEVAMEYDRKDREKVRGKWEDIIRSGNPENYGLIEQAASLEVMEKYPDIFHKCHIIAPIANIAGAMASIKAVKLLLGFPVKEYAVDLWNGTVS